MTAIPFIGAQAYFPDLAGAALANGSIYFWEAGTNNVPMTTWRDFDQNVINPNPIPLTNAGVPLYEIWGDGGYHIMWYDADNNLIGEIDDFFLTQNTGIPFAVTTGSPNAYIADPLPPIQGLVNGLTILIKANFTNTGASTINVSSTGIIPIETVGAHALVGGEIAIGGLYYLTYISGVWYLTNPTALLGDYYTFGGTSTALTITTTQGIGGYVAGMHLTAFCPLFPGPNVTIQIDSLAPKHITLGNSVNIDGTQMRVNSIYDFVYDGTVWQLLNPEPPIVITSGFSSTAPQGSLPLNGSTIAKTSGATYLSTLYYRTYVNLWNNLTNAIAPVSGGRGSSADADFNANKNITLPNRGDYSPIGVGAIVTSAGATAGASTHTPTGTISGTVGTSGSTVLDITQIPAHTHLVGTSDAGAQVGPDIGPQVVDYPGIIANNLTSSTGGGLGHTHSGGTFSGTFTGSSGSTQSPVFGVYYYINY